MTCGCDLSDVVFWGRDAWIGLTTWSWNSLAAILPCLSLYTLHYLYASFHWVTFQADFAFLCLVPRVLVYGDTGDVSKSCPIPGDLQERSRTSKTTPEAPPGLLKLS